jgi:hypothetical protein
MTGRKRVGSSAALWHEAAMRFLTRLLAIAGLALSAPSHAAAEFPAWLAGTWAMEDGAAWGETVWTSPRGGMMLGLGRIGFGATTENWESLRIQRKPDGSLALVVQPKGGTVVEWPMVLASADAVEFASSTGASPQRIRYWREGQLLMVETSRLDGSEVTRLNYRPVETGARD